MSLFLHYHHIQTYLNIFVLVSNKIIFFFYIRDMITDSREDLTNSVAAAVKEHKEIRVFLSRILLKSCLPCVDYRHV